MTTKKPSQQNKDKTMSLEDIVHWQDGLKKDIDFDKPDNELAPEEFVKKKLYLVMDKVVEEKLGTDVKKDIDETTKKIEMLSKFKTNINKLIELGREIEKNFIWQGVCLINHFDKSKENHFRLVVDGMTSDVVGANKLMSNSERVESAKKILEIIRVYRERVIKEFTKQEIISALLLALEKDFTETDFSLFGDEVSDKNSADKMKSQFQKWLNLSKELFKSRKKAIEAVEEQLDMDEILPKYIIENKGDITKNISAVNMKIKGDRMVRLTTEADKAEKEIEEERSKISEELFGKAESYVEFLNGNKSKETVAENKSVGMSKKIKWLIVIVLSIVALSGGIWTAIGVFILGTIIISILSK